MPKSIDNLNGDRQVAKVVATFIDSTDAPINIEAPTVDGAVDLRAVAIGVGMARGRGTAAECLRTVSVRPDGSGVDYATRGNAGGRMASGRFVWAAVDLLDEQPPGGVGTHTLVITRDEDAG